VHTHLRQQVQSVDDVSVETPDAVVVCPEPGDKPTVSSGQVTVHVQESAGVGDSGR
jgi:hypothetical protein